MKLLMLLVLASCSSTMLQDPKDKPEYAPADYVQRGKMKYLNAGMGWVINSRRENAFKQMHQSCGGDYKIVREGPQNYMDTEQYMIIEFECVDKTASK